LYTVCRLTPTTSAIFAMVTALHPASVVIAAAASSRRSCSSVCTVPRKSAAVMLG
jgi:hypothetical protein